MTNTPTLYHYERLPQALGVARAAVQVLSAHPTLESAAAAFLASLEGANRSPNTIAAYRADVRQFVGFLHDTDVTVESPGDVRRFHLTEYLTGLARQGVSGVSRARKLSAIRAYFRFLVEHQLLDRSPADGVQTPKKERKTKTFLRPHEYQPMLASAAGHPRNYAILRLFLQTGIRVSELCDVRVSDADLVGRVLNVHGKGNIERSIELDKKAIDALRSYLAQRPDSGDDHLFLADSPNPQKAGNPLSVRMVQHLVAGYRKAAGITKRATPHSLRHTFATYKAEKGVDVFQLKEWMGHQNINTTEIYVHIGKQNARKEMERTSLP